MYHRNAILCLVAILVAMAAYGQEVVVPLLPYDGTPATFVNNQIVADTVAAGGLSANRVYELQRDQYYFQNAIFTVPNGKTLRIRSAAGTGKKPILYLWETGTGSTPTRPPGNMVVLNGGNLEMKGFCVAGFYEYEPNRLDGVQGGLINTTGVGASIILDDMILSNINGQHVRTGVNAKKVQITNCIFANMGALTTSNLGAGKGIDLREAAIDTFIVVNNTFVNYQDRAIRHYNFSNPAAGTGELKYCRIEHNTFVNGMGFHGLLSLGNVGPEVIIANNLFVDAFALGEDSTDATRSAEWANTGEKYANGNNRITWIFTAPNTTTHWTVKNNYWTISDSGWAFLRDFGFGPGSPLSYHINSRLGADSVKAFKETKLSLNNTPRLMTNMMRWYEWPNPYGADKKKDQKYFDKTKHDYDRRLLEFYRDTLDCAYPTYVDAYTGSDLGLPVGDLNWFPDKKAIWEFASLRKTIAEAKVDANGDFVPDLKGQTVTVAGVITTPNYRPGGVQYYMQDETAGINIFSSAISYTLNPGDVVLVTGKIDQYRGLTEIIPQKVADIIVIGSQATPDPLHINKAMLTEEVEGLLVQMFRYELIDPENWKSDGTVHFTNGTDTVMVFIDNDMGIHTNPPPTGWVNLIGVVDQYTTKVPADVGYEIRPRSYADFVLITQVAGHDPNLPTQYNLHQNYPNPFNPATTISFDAPETAIVKIKVYDILGKEIATVFDGKLQAGYHTFQFDASKVPSGVYLYRVESKHYTSVKKMTVVK